MIRIDDAANNVHIADEFTTESRRDCDVGIEQWFGIRARGCGPDRAQPPLDRHAGRPHGLSTRVCTRTKSRGREAPRHPWMGEAEHGDAPNMAVVESNHIGDVPVKATAHAPVGHPDGEAFRDSPSGTPAGDRAAMHDRPPTAAAEAQAVGAVLFRAHDAARHLENLLELEAPDPRVAELMRDAKRVRKSISALLVDVAIADVELEGATR